MKTTSSISLLAVAFLAGCASQPETVTTEHKGKITIVHHRKRVGNGAIDHIDAIAANGTVTQAEVHVFDLGRYVDGNGNVHEAHKLYRTVQSERPNLMLPKHVSGGPKSVYTPPNYSPLPADQRINDAVAEAKQAKAKLDQASNDLQKRLTEDNNLKGELETQISENQRLQDQLNAAMATPHKVAPTAAEQAAQNSTSDLAKWGAQQQQ